MSRCSCVRKNEHYCLALQGTSWRTFKSCCSQILERQRGFFSLPNSIVEVAGKGWDFKNSSLNVLSTKQAESYRYFTEHSFIFCKEREAKRETSSCLSVLWKIRTLLIWCPLDLLRLVARFAFHLLLFLHIYRIKNFFALWKWSKTKNLQLFWNAGKAPCFCPVFFPILFTVLSVDCLLVLLKVSAHVCF